MLAGAVSPVIRIAELEIDPAHIERYRVLLSEQIEAAVALEPGVLFLHAVALTGTPHLIRILEGYADKAAYDAHLQTAHFRKYKMKTAAMILSLRLLPADPIALHAAAAVSLP